MKVKICGITNLEDALAAVEFGADALGFIFAAESPRAVSVEDVRQMIEKLPPFVTTVGVFTKGDERQLAKIVSYCGIDMIQFHGDFPQKIMARFSHQAIQVLKVKDKSALENIQTSGVRAVLLDTYHEKIAGGSGMAFDWEIARKATSLGKIILAGGLSPDNVQSAIQQAMPYGVDVSSGVEAQKRQKDHLKMKQFITTAKGTRVGTSSE